MQWLIVLLSISTMLNVVMTCNRAPQGTIAAKSPVDENFVVSLGGNPETYVPGQRYNGK